MSSSVDGVVSRLEDRFNELRNPEPSTDEKVEKKEDWLANRVLPTERDRWKYIEALTISDAGVVYNGGELNDLLSRLPIADLQELYLSLRNVFTPNCDNTHRCRIAAHFLGIAKAEWPELVKQVCFIMPKDAPGHDIMWATESLVSASTAYRKKLVRTAHRLFDYNTLTSERGYILAALAELSSNQLDEIDKFDEDEGNQFVRDYVPASLKEGAKLAYVYDRALEAGWNLETPARPKDGSIRII